MIRTMKTLIQNLFQLEESPKDLIRYRSKIHKKSAWLGLACNLFLFIIKSLLGFSLHSIALISDAFNSLSDCGSSVVAMVASWVAVKPADEEHPYGHARMEYVATFVVSFLILYIGLQLGMASFQKILTNQPMNLSWWILVVLILSILVKLILVVVTSTLAQAIDSKLLQATSLDNRFDILSNIFLLLSMGIMAYFDLNLDGYVGLVMAAVILYNGYGLLRDSGSTLLGKVDQTDLENQLSEAIKVNPHIFGFHNVKIHDYGPGRIHASVDIELPDTLDLWTAHQIIDQLERELSEKHQIHLVLHVDPISSNHQLTQKDYQEIVSLVQKADHLALVHDFKVIEGHLRQAYLFDVTTSMEEAKDFIRLFKPIVQEYQRDLTIKAQVISDNDSKIFIYPRKEDI